MLVLSLSPPPLLPPLGLEGLKDQAIFGTSLNCLHINSLILSVHNRKL